MPKPKDISVKNMRQGELYGIIYHEPTYSFNKKFLDQAPGTVMTFGKLRRKEKDFIDILIQWPEKKEGKEYEGLLIPKNFIKKIIAFEKP